MSSYRVAQVAAAGGAFEINAGVPGVRFPLVTGHEVAGRIEELGEGTDDVWQVGDRVAVGWFGGSLRPLPALPAR